LPSRPSIHARSLPILPLCALRFTPSGIRARARDDALPSAPQLTCVSPTRAAPRR
jgi:hypothetical protein